MGEVTDLTVSSVLCGLAVSDLQRSIDWTSRLLGRSPDALPMDGLADWHIGHGTLQLVVDPARAGGSLLTLNVPDIAKARNELTERGLVLDYDDISSSKVRFGTLTDPDGNAITLVEPREGFNPVDSGAG